jgi:hypothetical protein
MLIIRGIKIRNPGKDRRIRTMGYVLSVNDYKPWAMVGIALLNDR